MKTRCLSWFLTLIGKPDKAKVGDKTMAQVLVFKLDTLNITYILEQ